MSQLFLLRAGKIKSELLTASCNVGTRPDAYHPSPHSFRMSLAIFHDLPVEVWELIFFWCLPTPSNAAQHIVFMRRQTLNSPQYAPLLLCHVCRQWRSIVLSSPRLWTTLSVLIRLGAAVPAPDLVALWLSRSGVLPLDLALHQQNESYANCIAAGRILDVFKRRIPQWGRVHFELFGPLATRLGVNGDKTLPLLRNFRLSIADNLSGEDEEGLFGVFNHVPLLRKLHVSRIPQLHLSGRSTVQVPWRQLAYLSLDYVPAVQTALRILDMCPNLETCLMKIDITQGSLLYDPLRLPKLHTLSINLGFESLAWFLDQITLPQLINLTVSVRGPLEQYRWAQEQFDAFLTRSDCRIRRLEIHDTGMTGQEFVSCVRHPGLQALAELVINDTKGWTLDPFVTQAALDLLATPTFHHSSHTRGREYQYPDTCFLPTLERLTIHGNCFVSPDGVIANMVESRWRCHGSQVTRLNHLDLELPMNHVEDMRRLKKLQGEGLQVILSQQY